MCFAFLNFFFLIILWICKMYSFFLLPHGRHQTAYGISVMEQSTSLHGKYSFVVQGLNIHCTEGFFPLTSLCASMCSPPQKGATDVIIWKTSSFQGTAPRDSNAADIVLGIYRGHCCTRKSLSWFSITSFQAILLAQSTLRHLYAIPSMAKLQVIN